MRLLVLFFLTFSYSLNNGQGRTPAMGYSSWNDCSSDVSEARIKNITQGLLKTGLAGKGYIHVNVDEGWLKGRNSTTGEMYEDLNKFPDGMKALGTWVHSQIVPQTGGKMLYGLYTCRGTCQCSTSTYQGPGSYGYEEQDAQWMVNAGMDYLKEDSCCGSQDHQTAFNDYTKMRDALNASGSAAGRSIYFSLCGWNSWYAPVGENIGNSWRIAGDGQNWAALVNCINTNAQLSQYASPGSWNDPDLLIGTGVGSFGPDRGGWYQTDLQSRSQFSMWCVMTSPLLISADINSVSDYALETWGNVEAIAVNQDPMGKQGSRIIGTDLGASSGTNIWAKPLSDGTWAIVFLNNNQADQDMTCDAYCMAQMPFSTQSSQVGTFSGVQMSNCSSNNPYQQWNTNSNGMIINVKLGLCLSIYNCGTTDNTNVVLAVCSTTTSCSGTDQVWKNDSSHGTYTNSHSGKCLDQYEYLTSRVDAYTCNGGGNQNFQYNSQTKTLVAQQSQQCLTALPLFTNQTLYVRDLWAHQNLTPTSTFAGFTAKQVPGTGGVSMYKFSLSQSTLLPAVPKYAAYLDENGKLRE